MSRLGYYDIWVNSGGTIAASRASFYYANPVVVGALGYVDPLYDFDYCKFHYSTVGMLKVENSQDLVITNAEFLKPATGYNVAKMNNWGSVSFNDSYGDHSGSAFENDPYNRIHWTSGVNYLNAKVFLEGPYNGTNMNALLKVSDGFPLLQPYSTAPWNYNGTESVTSVPVDVVDWMLVEFAMPLR